MMRLAMAAAILIGMVAVGPTAQAQGASAYQIGRQVGLQRGVANPDCYARVFARHAQLVELREGGRSWKAQSTPAYNADMRRSCGLDRMALVRSQPNSAGVVRLNQGRIAQPRQQATVAYAPSGIAAGSRYAAGGGARGAGLRVAAERGYSGQAASCFAGVYARHAIPINDPNGRASSGWRGIAGNNQAYSRELWNECRIAR